MPPGDTRDQSPWDFQSVYGEFHARIRRYLERLVGPTEAEDLTQEVFLKVSQALPRFRRDSSLSTWIYRIATNTAYDKLRSPSFRRTGDVPVQELVVVDRASPLEQTLARREMNDCIDRFIAGLPANYRSVLLLSEEQGLTNQEIADALCLSLDTVKIRLHRARAQLRKALGSGCDFYHDDRNELACDPKPKGVSTSDLRLYR